MHIPAYHAENDLATLQEFIRQNPLGLVTTAIPHASIPTLQTSHVPFVLDTPDIGSSKGVLRAHMARANPQCKAMIDSLGSESSTLSDEILVLFTSPIHSYVTPKFYASTKPETGKVVPTWNYCAVQVYGKCKLYHSTKDPATDEYLDKQLNDLSNMNERHMAGKIATGKGVDESQEGVWKVADAPEAYVKQHKRGILGIEIEIDRIEGRFKMGQDKKLGDWEGVVAGFEALGTQEGKDMARTTREVGIRAGKCPIS